VLAQVHQAKGADAVPLRPGTAQDVSLEGGLLAVAQPLGATRTRLVVEALRSLGIEAQHRIAQRLALHPGQPSRFGPGHALERSGNGQQPQGRPAIPLARRSSA
jgi:acetyl-CoA acetyltransferase